MKISEAINFCLQYHKINSRNNTIKNYKFLLGKFKEIYPAREIDFVTTKEIISFLAGLSEGRKQNTKRSRYTTLSAFLNLIRNTIMPEMHNPCQSPAAKNLFRKPKTGLWSIFDKDIIDEVIFRTLNVRNRIMLELMARGGVRISEVLVLKPVDIDDQKLLLHDPKSGRERKIVFIPKKLSSRLLDSVRAKGLQPDQKIFPITYAGARKMVVQVGEIVGIKLRPHDLRQRNLK